MYKINYSTGEEKIAWKFVVDSKISQLLS